MKILITGAAGFIGSHLFDHLKKQGHDVWGFDNYSLGNYKKEGIFTVELLEKEYVARRIAFFQPEIIYHLAAWAHEGLSQFMPGKIIENNLNAFINTVIPAIKNNVRRIVLVSSMSVYGNQEPPFDETMDRCPVDIYGIAKTAMEQSLEVLGNVHGIEYMIVRPHNVYGERQNLSDPYRNVVAIFMNQCLRDKPFYIYGDGEQKRSFSYIADVVPPIAKAGLMDVIPGEYIFNIGPEREYSINQLAEIVLSEYGGQMPSPIYVKDRPVEVKNAYCTNQKARMHLGYKTTVSLFEGIKNMMAWAKSVGPQQPKYLDSLELESEKTPKTWSEHLI